MGEIEISQASKMKTSISLQSKHEIHYLIHKSEP